MVPPPENNLGRFEGALYAATVATEGRGRRQKRWQRRELRRGWRTVTKAETEMQAETEAYAEERRERRTVVARCGRKVDHPLGRRGESLEGE